MCILFVKVPRWLVGKQDLGARDERTCHRNALLFTPADRPITVRVTAAPRPTVEITDGGVGVPEDELPYVFDRFYRGRYAREQAIPGVGLGLTIARAAVAVHQGDLTVTSDPHGTTARVTLPGLDPTPIR